MSEYMSLKERLADTVLVVAHPDDEILWFSGVFPFVRQVLICYLETPGDDARTRARETLVSRFPDTRVEFLRISESRAFGQANWFSPTLSSDGLRLDRSGGHIPTKPGFSAQRYHANKALLVRMLRERLAGVPVVITHNPWGEYGHEEHVQVHRAVTELSTELGFDVWYDTYASDRSSVLLSRCLAHTQYHFETLPTQRSAVAPLEALYREAGCWTWPFDEYTGFDSETYALEPKAHSPHKAGAALPINWINVGCGKWLTPEPSLPWRLLQRVRKLMRSA